MGYTHYWKTPEVLGSTEKFKVFANDCGKIIDYCQNSLGIALAGGSGNGSPQVDDEKICFNGSKRQPIGLWTTSKNLLLAWPSDTASLMPESADPCSDKTDGKWYAGDLVSQRVAPVDNESGYGSGNYETCLIVRKHGKEDYKWGDGELYFDFCKTSYRPYDLTVTAVLIALKHHFPIVKISTDGEEKDWLDGRILCNNLLGYGMDIEIDY